MTTSSHPLRRRAPFSCGGLRAILVLSGLISFGDAGAVPTLRYQVDQRGDVMLFGNTVGHDCASPVVPVVGAKGASGCGTPGIIDSTEIDVLWRSEDPSDKQATADRDVLPGKGMGRRARSTAVLFEGDRIGGELPKGAIVTYARLYWAARLQSGVPPGTVVTLERPGPGGFLQELTSDLPMGPAVVPHRGLIPSFFYQSSVDITELVQNFGPGPYRVSGIDAIGPVDLGDINFVAWSVVVIYRRQSDPPRTITILDGLDRVENQTAFGATLTNFVPVDPAAGLRSTLGIVAYAGDTTGGERLWFRDPGQTLGSSTPPPPPQELLNPSSNIFNGTRTALGLPISHEGDLPQQSGRPGSVHGLDLDVFDVSALITRDKVSVDIGATTQQDIYFIGTLIGAVATLKPVFSDTHLTYANLNNPGGAIRPNDLIEFTLVTRNTGSDDSTDTRVSTQLPTGLSYVEGSLRILGGPATAPEAARKSDATGDDEAEYDTVARTVRARLGAGADASRGGIFRPEGPTAVVKYRVRIEPVLKDQTVRIQSVVTASGVVALAQGVPAASWASGNGVLPNRATILSVVECDGPADCTHPTPLCEKLPRTPPRCSNNCQGPDDKTTCAMAATGTQCLPSQRCGCTQDSDCLSRNCNRVESLCVLPQADLRLRVRTVPNPPVVGIPATHILLLENLGPGTAPGAVVHYGVPVGSTVKEVLPGEGWRCDKDQSNVTCTRLLPIPPGEAPPIHVVLDLPEGATEGTPLDINAGARVIGANDPDPTNNSVSRSDVISRSLIQLAGGGLSCALSQDAGPGQLSLLSSLLFLAIAWAFARARRRTV